MHITINLGSSHPSVVELAPGGHERTIELTYPNFQRHFPILPATVWKYRWLAAVSAVYLAVFVALPLHFLSFLEDGNPSGMWCGVGYAAILTAAPIVKGFAAGPVRQASFVVFSLWLTMVVAFAVFNATHDWGNVLPPSISAQPEGIYWSDMAKNALLVLGGGFAGNLLFAGVSERTTPRLRKKTRSAGHERYPTKPRGTSAPLDREPSVV